jgi:hypothetical protein
MSKPSLDVVCNINELDNKDFEFLFTGIIADRHSKYKEILHAKEIFKENLNALTKENLRSWDITLGSDPEKIEANAKSMIQGNPSIFH